MHYVIEEQGEGLVPEEGDTLVFHFETKNLTTGEDLGVSSRENNEYGHALPLDGLLQGVKEGFLLLKEGGTITMIVPSYLAFGKYGSGNVPPESIMQYKMELNIVLKY